MENHTEINTQETQHLDEQVKAEQEKKRLEEEEKYISKLRILMRVNRFKRKPPLEEAQTLFNLVTNLFQQNYGFNFDDVASDNVDQIFGYCFDATHKGAALLPLVCKNWKFRYESLLNKRLNWFLQDQKNGIMIGWLIFAIAFTMRIIFKIEWRGENLHYTLSYEKRRFILSCDTLVPDQDPQSLTGFRTMNFSKEQFTVKKQKDGIFYNLKRFAGMANNRVLYIYWGDQPYRHHYGFKELNLHLKELIKGHRPSIQQDSLPDLFKKPIPVGVNRYLKNINKRFKFF